MKNYYERIQQNLIMSSINSLFAKAKDCGSLIKNYFDSAKLSPKQNSYRWHSSLGNGFEISMHDGKHLNISIPVDVIFNFVKGSFILFRQP